MNNFNQPYYPGGMVQPFNYQPMYQNIPQNIQPQMQPQMQKIQPTEQFSRLQGKSVDSIEVVKAMDIPLDGSVSFFPLTDGSAIVTKQLQQDGTSKTIIYKPMKEDKKEEVYQYITPDEFNKQVNIINQNNNSLKEGVNDIRNQIGVLSDDFRQLLNEMKNFKGGRK